jgi:chaperonin GroES
MKVKPLNDWVVIIPDEAEGRTAGGIYIPDSAKDKPAEGVVEAVGPGAYEEEKPGKKERGKKERKFIPTSVKPGDHVLYEKYAGQRITLGPQERVLVREKNVLGYLPARPKAAPADPAPAHFPLVEIKSGERSLMKRGATAVALAHQHEKGALKPASKKAGKKAAKKAAKKAGKKAVKKAAGKPKRKAVPKPAAGLKKKSAAKKAKKKR